MSALATITLGIPPTFHVGPIELAWHGVTIALGIGAGGLLAARVARRRHLRPEPLQTIAIILTVGGLVGGRAFYLAEHGQLASPGQWLGTNGFTFDGGFIAVAIALAIYVRRTRLGAEYLDVVAAALPLGVAIGRIGDVINGEHYGPSTSFFLGVRNSHPDALVPDPNVAYHSGGLYEVLLGLLVFAVVWPLRHRLARRVTATVWLVFALFSAGRFVEFFFRADSLGLALGLNSTQWTSLAMLAASAIGAWWTLTDRRPFASQLRSAPG